VGGCAIARGEIDRRLNIHRCSHFCARGSVRSLASPSGTANGEQIAEREREREREREKEKKKMFGVSI